MPTIQERLAQEVTPAQYQKIRRLWLKHSIAEDKRDLDGLISTLTSDCVYEVIPTSQRWEGHAGARAFYTSFLGAFPDIHFAVTDLVIGPQGVIEIARMTGTHLGVWHDLQPTGKPIDMQIIIYFPWNVDQKLFDGEKVYYDSGQLRLQTSETKLNNKKIRARTKR
jgi:predicted ester cyclase